MTAKPSSTLKQKACALRAIVPCVLLALGGCAQTEMPALDLFADHTMPQTMDLATPIAPAPRPSAPLSQSFTARNLITGDVERFEVSQTGEGVRVAQSNGCTWTRSGDWFAPSDSWTRCDDSNNWHTGRAQVRETDPIWPLIPGAEGRWTRMATSHTNRQYTRESVCRVEAVQSVIREERAPTPAYIVVCRDGKRTRTTWFAPNEGPVAFRKVHDQDGVEEAWLRL